MPSRNVVKIYKENGFYHIYNRGVEKRKIFLDKNDYSIFTYLMQRCLDPKLKVSPNGLINLHSIADEAYLVSYCLMPNHFHFLIKQKTKDAVTKLLRRVLSSYVYYFNRKYEREGSLFQGKPRGTLIQDEAYLLHLSRYIHLNPSEIIGKRLLESYPYSSYPIYLGLIKTWINPHCILAFFKSRQKNTLQKFLSYQNFVEGYKKDPKDILGELTLD